MTENLGTAALYVTVDTEGMSAGVAKAKASIAGLSTDAQAQFERMSQAQKRAALSAVQFGENMGKTRAEIRALAAEQKIGGALGKEIAASIRAQEAAQKGLAVATGASVKELNRFGLSAKQQAAALRGVPAQLTDIATSLASGQRPITVLLQQGGQLKDMFGGVVPAARALGGAIVGLINPVTLAAAAVVGLGVAWAKAESEASSFARALALTGNQADLTVGKLRGMADEIDRSTSATAGKASEVLAQVAATGKFTADQINLISKAAINLESATGRSIENTVAEFASLAKDPVEAILKLNEAVGDGTNVTHFLTEAQVRAIEKFKEQGNEAEATRIAIEAYAEAINGRTPEVVRNLTLTASVFRDIKTAATEFGDSAVGVFRDLDVTARAFFQNYGENVKGFAEAIGNLKFIPGASSTRFLLNSFVDNANKPDFSNVQGSSSTKSPIVDSKAERERLKAREEFDRLHLSNLSKQERLEAEIAKIKETGAKAGKSQAEIAGEVANARARYAESLPKGRKKRDDSATVANARERFDDMVGRFKGELEGPLEKAEQDHLRRVREIEQAAKTAKVSHDELAAALGLEGQAYKKTADEINHRFEAEVAQLSGPIAQAQQAHEAQLRRIEELKQQGALTSAQYTAALENEAKAYEDDMRAAERAADPIGALLSDMQLQVDMIGKSNAVQAISNELVRQGIDLSSEYAQAKIAEAQAIQQQGEAQQRAIDLMDDFRQGASNAIADFVTGAKSAKEAFADFFDDLARRITQMIAERWIEKAFGAQGSDGSGTSGGGWISAIAGLLANANGNAFNNGQVMAFANGGVFDSPTYFPMRGGRLGLMGEAGPEAIMPLQRGPDGKLGVRMSGESGGVRNVTNNNTYVIQERTNRRTQEQLERSVGRGARRGMARTGG